MGRPIYFRDPRRRLVKQMPDGRRFEVRVLTRRRGTRRPATLARWREPWPWLLAGPNGAGKEASCVATLYDLSPEIEEVVNPDDIASAPAERSRKGCLESWPSGQTAC